VAVYQVLYWKDIPAQIRVFQDGGKPISRALPDSFQIEIDRVAMAEGLTDSDVYLSHWHWSAKMERPGAARDIAELIVRELQEQWALTRER
jgi:hypothetical protein